MPDTALPDSVRTAIHAITQRLDRGDLSSDGRDVLVNALGALRGVDLCFCQPRTVDVRRTVVAFTRYDDVARPGQPTELMIKCSRTVSDEEAGRIAAAIGYAYAETIAGPSLGDWEWGDDFQTIMLGCSPEASPRTDIAGAWQQFLALVPLYVRDGSPVRTTNRAGAGTRGTRLVPGVGPTVTVEVWGDDWIC